MTNKQMIVLLIATILSSILASGGAMVGGIWFLKNMHATEGSPLVISMSNSDETTEKSVKNTETHASFYPLEKLVLSVKGKKQTHFVMLELAVETKNPGEIAAIDKYMPKVKNVMLTLFSKKTFEELHQNASIETLQAEVKQTLLMAFSDTEVHELIDDIIVTKYVMQ